MREIKFRAWIKDAEMCYEDSGMYYQHDQYLSSFIRRILDQYVVTHESYLKFKLEDRLMQYTGLLDKNGKEIYEGDIVSIPGAVSLFGIGAVVNYRGAFGAELDGIDKKPWLLCNINEKDIEIIGNIYQNPELLTSKD